MADKKLLPWNMMNKIQKYKMLTSAENIVNVRNHKGCRTMKSVGKQRVTQ